MFSLFSIAKKREDQLNKEHEVDKLLKVALSDCPIILAQFLLARREENRKQFNEVSGKNILFQIEPISNNIDKLNLIYDSILEKVTSGEENCSICKVLEKYK
jgi:hypothetical protein